MSNVKIDIKELGRTNLAILVSDGRTQAWVPLSHIVEEVREPAGGILNEETTVAIIVPEWLASEKGLQQTDQDVNTMDLFSSDDKKGGMA